MSADWVVISGLEYVSLWLRTGGGRFSFFFCSRVANEPPSSHSQTEGRMVIERLNARRTAVRRRARRSAGRRSRFPPNGNTGGK